MLLRFEVSHEFSNILKGFAILLVIIYHLGGFLGVTNYFNGQVGVDLFIFVSAYGIAKSIDNYQSAEAFLLRRFSKIYIKYIIAIVIAGVLFSGFTFGNLLTHITLTHGLFSKYFFGFENAYWYMSLIGLCYVFCAVIYKYKIENYSLIIGLCLFLLLLMIYKNDATIVSHFVARIPIFVFTYYFAMNSDKINTFINLKYIYIINIFMVLLVFYCIIFYCPGIFSSIGIIIFHLLLLLTLLQISLVSKIISFFGKFSYELYLMHDLGFRAVINIFPNVYACTNSSIFITVIYLVLSAISIYILCLLLIAIDKLISFFIKLLKK